MLELREKLTRTEVALQERTAALATRDAALAEANRPVIPVRVTFRLAFMGQGLVASIRNVTDRPLNVIAELRDAGSDPSRSVSLALEPNIGNARSVTRRAGRSPRASQSPCLRAGFAASPHLLPENLLRTLARQGPSVRPARQQRRMRRRSACGACRPARR